MKSVKYQAKVMGYQVIGNLKRIKDDVFCKNGKEIHLKQYVDSEGTLYAINSQGNLIYIAGDDWCI